MTERSLIIVKEKYRNVTILFSIFSCNWGEAGYKTTLSSVIVNSQWLMLLLIVLLLLTNPAMLISLRKVASKQQQQQGIEDGQGSRGRLLDALDPAKQLSQPRRLSHLKSSPSSLPETLAVKRSKSSTFRPKTMVESEAQLRHKRQHAFELRLEEMLFEVEKGWATHFGSEKDEKEVVNKTGVKPAGWQKIWYKRLG